MAKILIMEDETDQAELLRAILSNAGHDVTVSYNGNEAWRLLTSQPYDVLVTDMTVKLTPKAPRSMGGLSLISKIRFTTPIDTPVWVKKIRIVAITGVYNKETDFLEAAKSVGADVCLRKPASITDILQAVEPDAEE